VVLFSFVCVAAYVCLGPTVFAKAALSLIESGRIKIIKIADAPGRTADDAILSLLKTMKEKNEIKKTAVATNDAKLRKRIKALDVKLIYLRARKYLEID
jgi:rRNA-processing protein FCF1